MIHKSITTEIYYTSLYILLNPSYMVCGLKIYLVTPCHFNEHRVILHVGVWLEYFIILFKKIYLMISKQQRDKEKTCFVKGWECDPKTKCRMAKIHNKMIDSLTPFLDQVFYQYLCFAKHFLSFVVLRMFWWQYD